VIIAKITDGKNIGTLYPATIKENILNGHYWSIHADINTWKHTPV
jgi:hypothetical protein